MDTPTNTNTRPWTKRSSSGHEPDRHPAHRPDVQAVDLYMYVIRLPKVVAVRRLILTFTNPPLFLWRSAQHH